MPLLPSWSAPPGWQSRRRHRRKSCRPWSLLKWWSTPFRGSREAFLLQRQHGLNYSEIAQVMGISPSTVEKHMIRARKALREALSSWC